METKQKKSKNQNIFQKIGDIKVPNVETGKMWTEEKPDVKCKRCGKDIEPIYFPRFGYAKYQPYYCEECQQIIKKEQAESSFVSQEKYRKNNLYEIAIKTGAPSDKVNMLKGKKYDRKFQVEFPNKSKKIITAEEIFKLLIKHIPVLLQGESDSSKTYFSTYLYLKLLNHFHYLSENRFNYTYLHKIYSEIVNDRVNKYQIIDKYMYSSILVLTFGEYDDELSGKDLDAYKLAKEIMFKILEYRNEESKMNDLVTLLVTTLEQEHIESSYGKAFIGRILEKYYSVQMPVMNYREKAFENRPRIIAI